MKPTRSCRTVSERDDVFPDRVWRELEVLGYDLNTCMGETTVSEVVFLRFAG